MASIFAADAEVGLSDGGRGEEMAGAAKLVGRVLDQQASHYEAMRVSVTRV
jgi:hypothetical protein